MWYELKFFFLTTTPITPIIRDFDREEELSEVLIKSKFLLNFSIWKKSKYSAKIDILGIDQFTNESCFSFQSNYRNVNIIQTQLQSKCLFKSFKQSLNFKSNNIILLKICKEINLNLFKFAYLYNFIYVNFNFYFFKIKNYINFNNPSFWFFKKTQSTNLFNYI
jgi:hypothetical protein